MVKNKKNSKNNLIKKYEKQIFILKRIKKRKNNRLPLTTHETSRGISSYDDKIISSNYLIAVISFIRFLVTIKYFNNSFILLFSLKNLPE